MRSKISFLLNQATLLFQDLTVGERMAKPPAGVFVKGINFGGEAVTIEGHAWESYHTALAQGLKVSGIQEVKTKVIPQPYASRDTRQMLNSVICKPQPLQITQPLINGSYQAYIWLMENYRSEWHTISVNLQGKSVAEGIGKLPFGGWACYGPYSATVIDGALQLTLSTPDGVDSHIMGLSIFRPA